MPGTFASLHVQVQLIRRGRLRISRIAGLVGLATIAAVSAAHAQMGPDDPSHLGIAAGAAIPTGILSDSVSSGFNLTGMIGIEPPGFPVGFRLEAAYNKFPGKAGGSGTTISSATVNVLWTLPVTGVSPYAIGGLGYYRHSGSIGGIGRAAANRGGFNVGAGLRVPLSRFDTFVEARYNHVAEHGATTTFVPVTFGIFF